MNYQQAVDFLFSLEKFGIKLGLENTFSLMKRLGNPHLKFTSIHVAGTNGKGSCCAMLYSILRKTGYSCGLYTSPHLVDFRERIRVGESLIEKDYLKDFVSDFKGEILKKKYTFFEVITALAFSYFADRKIELAVVETGLGGRLDSTNILKPEVSVITNIGLEHTDRLGRTLEKIAREKAGIIKDNVPTVTSIEREKPFKVIESLCRQKKSELFSVFKDCKWEIKESSIAGIKFNLKTRTDTYSGIRLNLAGEHQVRNAACAILAIENLTHQGFKVDKKAILSGLKKVNWPGRLEVYCRNPLVILDVAHNPDGIRNLTSALKKLLHDKNIYFIFGVMEDKNYRKMLQIMSRIAKEIILTQLDYQRSAKLDSLADSARKLGLRYSSVSGVKEAYQSALKKMKKDDVLCVTGSHFTVGEFLSCRKNKK
ncbi:MAG: bifunctional folylpolyglutamate synthase/dihydrofolate synthase [candidate division Zixibacteria bacterium]|nr:bifunctional folylpolyglutamate synthase/dihydrofolate synthase [candidate division Zixibacteria bacterium]